MAKKIWPLCVISLWLKDDQSIHRTGLITEVKTKALYSSCRFWPDIKMILDSERNSHFRSLGQVGPTSAAVLQAMNNQASCPAAHTSSGVHCFSLLYFQVTPDPSLCPPLWCFLGCMDLFQQEPTRITLWNFVSQHVLIFQLAEPSIKVLNILIF